MLKRLWKKFKDAQTNKNILKDEAKFLKDTDRYDFFGYFNNPERELPVFITEGKVEDGCKIGEFIYVYTPKMLEHCVKYLTEDAKLREAQDIESFNKKCNKLAERAIYQNESWEYVIRQMSKYLETFKKAKKHEKTVLKRNSIYECFDSGSDLDVWVPFFYTYEDKDTYPKFSEGWVATPKILKHCVEYMSDDLKQYFAKYNDIFIGNCRFIMNSDKDELFLKEDWQDMINSLVEYLQEYNINNENNV